MKTTAGWSKNITLKSLLEARRFSNYWWIGVVVCALVMSPAATAVNANELGLDDAVKIAVADSPNLAAMQARFEAMSAIPSQVGTLPDPVLSIGVQNFPTDTFHVGQEAMTQVQIGISQRLPCTNGLSIRIFPATLDHDVRYPVFG